MHPNVQTTECMEHTFKQLRIIYTVYLNTWYTKLNTSKQEGIAKNIAL